MAAGSNGKVVQAKQNGLNGHATVVPTLPATKSEKKIKKKSSGFFGFGTITRYAIYPLLCMPLSITNEALES